MKKYKFWKKKYISCKKFLEQAKNGDILLFKGKLAAQRALRMATQSDYDHVGIVVVNNNRVCSLEAFSTTGVQVFSWGNI